jgi:hypothetical protein
MGSVLHREPSGEGARPHLVHMVEAAGSPRHWPGRWVPTDSTRRRRRARGSSLIGAMPRADGRDGALYLEAVYIESEAENVRARPHQRAIARHEGRVMSLSAFGISGAFRRRTCSDQVYSRTLFIAALSRHLEASEQHRNARLPCHHELTAGPSRPEPTFKQPQCSCLMLPPPERVTGTLHVGDHCFSRAINHTAFRHTKSPLASN